MNLVTREEIDAPRETVWKALTRFDRFERQLRKRDIPIEKEIVDGDPRWTVQPTIAGTARTVVVTLDELEPPERLHALATGSGLAGAMKVTLEALDEERTAMTVSVSLRGTSLAGKAIVGGLRVGQGKIEERFVNRVRKMIHDIAKG